MLGSESKALGTWTIVALVMTAVIALAVPTGLAGFGHATGLAAPSSGIALPSEQRAAPVAHASPMARPLAGPSPPINASVVITTTFSGSQDLPTSISWTINVTNTSLNAGNVSQTLLVMNGANEIANASQPIMTNTTDYSATIDYGLLNSENFGGGTLPTTPYTFWVWLTAWNTTNGSVSWVNASSSPVSATLLIANVGVLFTSSLPLYSSLPFTIAFTTTFSGNTATVINQWNVTVNLELRFIESGCGSLLGFGAACDSVANETIFGGGPNGVVDSNGSYAFTVGTGDFGAQNFVNGQLPVGEYQVILWTTIANVNDPAQAPRVGAAAQYTYPVFHPNTATFLSPSPTSGTTAGNVTISVWYEADYLASANVTVYQGASGSTVVFSGGVFAAGNYAHAGASTWAGATVGEYRVVLTILTAAGSAAGQSTFTELFNVTSAAAQGGGTVYFNQTIWVNTTTTKPVTQALLGGLGPGAGAAILLVAGLIIGMIVALLLGRMMWSGQKPGSPQPWSAKGTNECSVCHQTFPTEAELKEHTKQAHGMG